LPVKAIDEERRVKAGFARHSDRNTWNCDETAFFHNALAKYSWQQRDQRGRDVLNEDGSVAVTLLIVAKHFPIGLPRGKIQWTNGTTTGRYLSKFRITRNSKGWMTITSFSHKMSFLNDFLMKEKRHVLMLVDNCSAHTHELHFSNIKFFYLMPNVTNHIQPLDQLFINYVKRLYKKWLNELLAKNDGGQPTKLTKINKIAELHASVPFLYEIIKVGSTYGYLKTHIYFELVGTCIDSLDKVA